MIPVVDTRTNRVIFTARIISLVMDVFFFYTLTIGVYGSPCLYLDGTAAATTSALRTFVDVIHLYHIFNNSGNSLATPVFDILVILPLPQVLFWLVIPKLIQENQTTLVMILILVLFLLQFIPKIYHAVYLLKWKVTGYLFGTVWWRLGVNLVAYLTAAQVAGGSWYVIAIERVANCVRHQCGQMANCTLHLRCPTYPCYRFPLIDSNNSCTNNVVRYPNEVPYCLSAAGLFPYGIFKSALPVISSDCFFDKIRLSFRWGLKSLSTFGSSLKPTADPLELIFNIIIIAFGVMLFTALVANSLEASFQAGDDRKRKSHLRRTDIEWWMKKRVRRFELESSRSTGGTYEIERLKDLPVGLRRDIKRYLYLDFMKKVPLLNNLDDLVLYNLCDRVNPLTFTTNEKVTREGNPLHRMIFIMRGRLESSRKLSNGMVVTTCTLGPGNFVGDELLSWCLRRPLVDRLPASSVTIVCEEETEAFGLDAKDLLYMTDRFRHKFANERLIRKDKYYSQSWRTWGAVGIQIAWNRYRLKTRGHPAAIQNGKW
ncbi:hypothetical protein MKX03_032220 [Papaver bracteatum]|nr:hypothetical protein MKX03_032220 [Papaver bracteatum]